MTQASSQESRPAIDVTFYFGMNEAVPVRANLSKEVGFQRSFALLGYCQCGETDSRNRFGNRKVRATFVAPQFAKLREFGLEHGVDDACGYILIRKDVEPKHYEDHDASDPPIDVVIHVTDDNLDRIWEVARGSIGAKHLLSLSLTMASNALPARELRFMLPDDLDISDDHRYPISSFSLSPTIQRLRDPVENRPRRPQRKWSAYASFSAKLNEVRAEMYGETLQLSKAWLEGKITQPSERRGVSTSIEIEEYERDLGTNEYPDEAAPGAYVYSPENAGYLSLVLRFTQRDFDRVLPLLLSARNSYLDVSLDVSKTHLMASKETVRGDLMSFSFRLDSTKAS